MAQGSMFVVS